MDKARIKGAKQSEKERRGNTERINAKSVCDMRLIRKAKRMLKLIKIILNSEK